MRKLIVLLAALSTAVALGAATAGAANDPVRVTFDKHLVDPASLTFAGTTAGDAPGTLVSKLVSIDGVSGPIFHITFDWIVSAGDRSFVARTSGIWNTGSGLVEMNGSVTSGYLQGAQVHEQGRLVDPETLEFQGLLQLMPATA